jgi:hypothetical protein
MINISTLTKCLSDDLCADYRGSHLDGRSTVSEAAFGLLQESFLKKFSTSKRTLPGNDDAALEKFLQCNVHCGEYTVKLNTSADEELFGTFQKELYNFFYPHGMPLLTSLDQIWDHGRNGPGASILSPHGSAYAKLWGSGLSYSKIILKEHFLRRISQFPRWDAAEVFRQSTSGLPRYVDSSRLSFVPKNDRISRTICTEPVLNMFYQLGIGRLLADRLAQVFGIMLETQADVNREMARCGSEAGSIGTIDLESASDTIAMNLIKEIIPKDQLSFFLACRSENTLVRGQRHRLHMISSMGNGFTFPLQTVIFACAVRAVYSSLGIYKRVAVFGDDIICESRAYQRLSSFLSLLGFKVNGLKSFNTGPFRESCGHDLFKGVMVRGVYVKALSNPAEIYVAVNRLIDWSVEHRHLLVSTIKFLLGHLPRKLLVPMYANASEGLRVPFSVASSRLGRDRNGSIRYRRLEWVPRRVSIHAGKVPGSRRSLAYNPDGLVLSILYGESVAAYVTSRDVGRWKTKRRVTPFWDYPYESSVSTDWRTEFLTTLSSYIFQNQEA